MTANSSLAMSVTGLVAGICIALTLLFSLIFDSFRMGLVTGIAAGAIVSVSLLLIDVSREDVDSARRP